MMAAVEAARRAEQPLDLSRLAAELRGASAEQRVAVALEQLPGQHVLSSSFGAQAAVSLHLVTRHLPRIPVVLIDTGYLFPETYRFIDELAERLDLNLKVYRSARSSAWQEARHGRLWEQGREGLDEYHRIHKVEPMERALRELHAGTWFAGLRREQSASRAGIEPVQRTGAGRYKVHPLFDWTDRDVYRYLRRHDLPYHPLWEQGYVSIGDWHTTRRLRDVEDPEATRFFGLKRECGLHEIGGSGI
ncbi:MAG TPA: phosphoadenylyl-sulfate reductase [Steroidobacteraceae bacterium]|nr:phosphoadenylyl-sulfate reductase [Steroidobacteraceae bacterium]